MPATASRSRNVQRTPHTSTPELSSGTTQDAPQNDHFTSGTTSLPRLIDLTFDSPVLLACFRAAMLTVPTLADREAAKRARTDPCRFPATQSECSRSVPMLRREQIADFVRLASALAVRVWRRRSARSGLRLQLARLSRAASARATTWARGSARASAVIWSRTSGPVFWLICSWSCR